MTLQVSPPKAVDLVSLPPGSTFGPRQMLDWQFLWFLEGNCLYERDGEQRPVQAGTILFCVPNATERFWWDSKRPTRCIFAHFEILQTPPEWTPYLSWEWTRPAREGDVFTSGFRHLFALIQQRPRDELGLTLTLALMVASWQNSLPPRILPAHEATEPVRLAMAWLHAQLEQDAQRPVTLKEMAAAACVTPNYLCRVFANSTGRTPLQTVMLARLDRALELVTRSEVPMERVAAMCGFSDAAHLSRRFRVAFQCTPRECRQRVRQGHLPPEYCLTRRYLQSHLNPPA